ncbi:MAG: hypothetical protein ACOYL6_07590 [Bacteriovoracaceae bacterium]
MIYRVILILSLATFSTFLRAEGASDDAVRLLEFTPKHKTVMLGKGHLDGLKPTHKGYLVIEDDGEYINLGRGEAVKVFAGYSVWSMENPISYPLKKDQIIYLRNQTEFYGHMPKLKVSRKRVIGDRISPDTQLTKHEEQFVVNQEIEGRPAAFPEKRVLIDQEEWRYREDENGRVENIPHASKKNVKDEAFKDKFQSKRYADLVDGENEQMREDPVDMDHLHKAKKTGSEASTYTEMNESKYQRDLRAQESLKEKKRKGLGWSDEMSDEELQSFIARNGIDFEMRRRLHLMNKRYSMEATFSFGFKLNNSTQTNYAGGNSGMNSDFGLGLEYFLGSRYQLLDHFSLEADVRKGSNEVFFVNSNASLSEFTYGMSAYWYPFMMPGTVGHNLFFVGAGARRGTVQANDSIVTADYSTVVLPVFSAGVRYHFDNQFGLRLLTSMETFNLSLVSQSTGGQLPVNTSYSNLKVVGGLSYYF